MTAPRLSDNGPKAVITVQVPSDIVTVIDAVASAHLKIRSVWLREAIMEKIDRDNIFELREEYGLTDMFK